MDHRRLPREIDKLKARILVLSGEVEDTVRQAVECIAGRDLELARQVIDHDSVIDQAEVDLEEECLKLLALYQPVAVDLRFIVAVLKINNDLERIGDLAANIASRALQLGLQPSHDPPFDFDHMAQAVRSMLRRSLDALVNMDPVLAHEVCASDDEVDRINREMYREVERRLGERPEEAGRLILLLGVSRLLERIADHTTNIAEDVIYLTTGEIVRHRIGEDRHVRS